MTNKTAKKKSKEKRDKKDKKKKQKTKSGSSKKPKNYNSSFSSLVSTGSEGSLQLGDDGSSKGSSSAFECNASDFAFGGNFGESASSLKLPEEYEEEKDEPKSELDVYLASLEEPNPYKTQYITINPEERKARGGRLAGYGSSSRSLTASCKSLPTLDESDAAWLFDKESDDLGSSISSGSKLDPSFKEKLLKDGLLDDAALKAKKKNGKHKKEKQPKNKSKQKLSKELFNLLNLDPYRKKARKKYSDYDVKACFQVFPELAREKYEFTVFDEEDKVSLYPLSMLLALGASKVTVKCCYEAYPDALHHIDDNLGSPLHYAAEFEGTKDVIEYLGGQDDEAFMCVNEDERTPLHLAAMNDAPLPTLAAILAANPDALMQGDCDGNTPLHLACSEEAELDIIEEMMDENKRVCVAKSNSGATPLHLAIFQESSFKVIDSMVASNVKSLEVADEKGRIPLHVAASSDVSAKIVQLLINKYPAGVQACTSRGKTPYALAKKAKRDHNIRAMLKHDH